MSGIDPAAAAANAQALADSFAQAADEQAYPVSSGAEHVAEDESQTNKRKFDGGEEEPEGVTKRPTYSGFDSSSVRGFSAACTILIVFLTEPERNAI